MRPQKSPKASDMATLIGSCPIHKAVVKAVGYGSVSCQDVVTRLKDVIAQHGQPAVDGVARALLEYEHQGTVLYCKLRPALHVYCRMLLGPMPSEWETWWQNPDGTDRKGKPKDWLPNASGPAEDPASVEEKGVVEAAKAPSDGPSTEVEQLKATHGRQLRLILKAAHDRFLTSSPDDPTHTEAVRQMDLVEAEMRSRDVDSPEPPMKEVA